MMYYDLEAFRGYERTHKILSLNYSLNDAYFLKNIYWEVSLENSFEYFEIKKEDEWRLFTDILKTFYNYYSGDKAQWIHHTMNIICSYDNYTADLWIEEELRSQSGNVPNQAEVLQRNKQRIHKRDGSLNDILSIIAEPYGWSVKGLRDKWYDMIRKNLI